MPAPRRLWLVYGWIGHAFPSLGPLPGIDSISFASSGFKLRTIALLFFTRAGCFPVKAPNIGIEFSNVDQLPFLQFEFGPDFDPRTRMHA